MCDSQLEKIVELKDKFYRIYPRLEYEVELKEKIKERYEKGVELLGDLTHNKDVVSAGLNFLKQWHSDNKKAKINNLQNQINEVLSVFFPRNYNLKLVTNVRRGKENVDFVEDKGSGMSEDLIDVKAILSGAESQLVGFLIQTTTLEALDSDFILLDEAFSSFGIKEVAKIPTVLGEIGETQIVIIEHKSELFENTNFRCIELGIVDGHTEVLSISEGDEDIDTNAV